MKNKIKIAMLAACTFLFSAAMNSQSVPKPDHVVVLMLENNGYGDVIGSSNAPYINSLANDPANATFTQSFAMMHPSQPNYIMLYSGSNQGITNDNNVTNAPFSTPNLGASLLSHGYSFKGFCEDLPAVGSLTYYSGGYGRKHAPWTNWQGTGTNQLPSTVSQPYTSFPTSSAYSTLPTVSFVIPNLSHDMHDPISDPSAGIRNGDTWVKNNMANYIAWAKANNSLLIITFDEDRGEMVGGVSNTSNQITTIFIGGMVQGGSYATHINHYDVLRTIEDMYGLPYAGNSASASSITNCWKAHNTTGISDNASVSDKIAVWPNPAIDNIHVSIGSSMPNKAQLTVYDITGRLVKEEKLELQAGTNLSKIDAVNFSSGVYIVKIAGTNIDFTRKIVVEK